MMAHAAFFTTVPQCAAPLGAEAQHVTAGSRLSLLELAPLRPRTSTAPLERPFHSSSVDQQELLAAASSGLPSKPQTATADGLHDNGGYANSAAGTDQGNSMQEIEQATVHTTHGADPQQPSDGLPRAEDQAPREEPAQEQDAAVVETAAPEAPSEEEPSPEQDHADPSDDEVDELDKDEEPDDPTELQQFVPISGSLSNPVNRDSQFISELDQHADIESRSVLLKRVRQQEIGTTTKTTDAQEERRRASSSDAREGVQVAGGRLDRARALRRGAIAPPKQPASSASPPPPLHAEARVLAAQAPQAQERPEWWRPLAARLPSRRPQAPSRTTLPQEESSAADEPRVPTHTPTALPRIAAIPAPAPPSPPEIVARRTGMTPQQGAADALDDAERDGDTSEGGELLDEAVAQLEPDQRPTAATEGVLLVERGLQNAADGDPNVIVEAPSLRDPQFNSSPSSDDESTHVTGAQSNLSQRYVLSLDNALSARRSPLGSYTNKIYRRLMRNWERLPDPDLGVTSLSTQVTITFLVFSDGRVVRPTIHKTSGDPMLDHLALASIPSSLPRFPRRLHESSLFYEMTFSYEGGR